MINNKRIMTLIEIIEKIKNIAKKQVNVGYVGEGDIYELNSLPNVDYSVIFITQSNHSITPDLCEYTLNVFYIDRLFNDKSNRLSIHSHGISIINNIINTLEVSEDVNVEYPVAFTTFNHRFTDECAGVFATIKISTDNELGLCAYE